MDTLESMADVALTADTQERSAPTLPRYVAVADEFAQMIQRGQLRIGERLPSVRELARGRRVSLTTALAVLRELEARGLAEARPQSGYYVRGRMRTRLEPSITRPPTQPQPVAVNALIARVVGASLDRGVVPFGAAIPEPSWFPVPALQRQFGLIVRQRPDALGDYDHSYGAPELRRQIARRCADLACVVDDDDILVTNGCIEALNLAIRSVAGPGDTIAIESPAYFGFLQMIEDLGMKALEIPTHPREGFCVEALATALGEEAGARIRAVLVSPNFNNPLGSLMPEAQKRALLQLCERHRIALIEDDVYGDLHFAGTRPLPIKAYDRSGTVILCSSYTKTLAPGARIGWVAAGRWREAIGLRKFVTSVSTPVLPQLAIAEFLRTRAYARHLVRLRQRCAAQTARFSECVDKTFPVGTRVARPQGGFVLWVELPSGVDTLELYARALARRINFAPGPMFSPSQRYRNCLRLNCGRQWTPQTEAALALLGRMAGE